MFNVLFWGVGIGDINRDGLNDVVVGCVAADVLDIFAQNKGGILTQTGVFRTEWAPYGVAVGDVTGVGKNDIVISNSGASSISIFTWLSDVKESYNYLLGSFKKCESLTIQRHEKEIFPHIVYAAGPIPYWVTIGDINGDYQEDIAIINYGDETFNIYLQQPDRSLLPVGALQTTDGGIFNVCVGDTTEDGLSEIITSGSPPSIFGRKDETSFELIGAFTTKEERIGAVRVGNVNNDVGLDLVATNADTISIYLQDKSRKLLPPTYHPTGKGPGGLAIADVNNDGVNDIIMGNIHDNSISVLHPVWVRK